MPRVPEYREQGRIRHCARCPDREGSCVVRGWGADSADVAVVGMRPGNRAVSRAGGLAFGGPESAGGTAAERLVPWLRDVVEWPMALTYFTNAVKCSGGDQGYRECAAVCRRRLWLELDGRGTRLVVALGRLAAEVFGVKGWGRAVMRLRPDGRTVVAMAVEHPSSGLRYYSPWPHDRYRRQWESVWDGVPPEVRIGPD